MKSKYYFQLILKLVDGKALRGLIFNTIIVFFLFLYVNMFDL